MKPDFVTTPRQSIACALVIVRIEPTKAQNWPPGIPQECFRNDKRDRAVTEE